MTKVRKKIGTIPPASVQQKVDDAITQMQTDVSNFIDEETAQYPEIGGAFKFQEDPEGRSEITTDSEGKIIAQRDSNGMLHENVGIKTNRLTLSEEGVNEFQQVLNNSGFRQDGLDNFSDKMVVEIPEPKKYAIINIITDKLPDWWSDTCNGYVEYYDFSGNYFKKSCELSTQGQTSREFAINGGKGNYTLDITDGSEIKFGSWVFQDSFHLKGCAKDVTKGFLATSYKLAYKMMQFLDAKPNRVLLQPDTVTTTSATGDWKTDFGDDARCISDGFPCEIYHNGNYWGLYSLQLKKHRKNYSMDKSDYTSFIIDASDLMPNGLHTGFWLGDIQWDMFEIRNPKNLICMDGSEYDGDNPKELIDSSSEYFDSSNKKHKGTATTKAIIQSFSTRYLEIKALVDAGTTESLEEAKTLFAEYFDVNACMLVYIFNCTMRNNDSIRKNTLWAIYKNGKIAPMLWDLDGVYGEGWTGIRAVTPSAYLWNGDYATAEWPLKFLKVLFYDEMVSTYANLRSSNILSMDSWKDVIKSWFERIGVEAYKRDITKWPETPSYRENYTNTEYWKESSGSALEWDETQTYNIGDKAFIKLSKTSSYTQVYEAVKVSSGICPVTKFYEKFPVVGGYYNSLQRMEKWMREQISLCDSILNYNN